MNTGLEVEAVISAVAPPLTPTTLTIRIVKHPQPPRRMRRITMAPRVTMLGSPSTHNGPHLPAAMRAIFLFDFAVGWLRD